MKRTIQDMTADMNEYIETGECDPEFDRLRIALIEYLGESTCDDDAVLAQMMLTMSLILEVGPETFERMVVRMNRLAGMNAFKIVPKSEGDVH